MGVTEITPLYVKFDHNIYDIHLQKRNIITTGGMEANFVLSQKILRNLLAQNIDPITAGAYIFSAMDQLLYALFTREYNDMSGNDIEAYLKTTQILYGKESITLKKLKTSTLIDLLNPMVFAALYSTWSGNNIHFPVLNITKNIGIIPSCKLILTPYGVLEKRLIAHIFTDYTPIRASFGFGKKESKTNNSTIKENNTYYGELVVDKVLTFEHLNLGATLAAWKQPVLFTNDSYNAEIKKGGMWMLNLQYKASDSLEILADLGYKSEGYVLGQPVTKTPIVRFGLQWKV